MERLTEAQQIVAGRVIVEESAKREHLVVYLSGAHAYGFPSPDSDVDLKCIHIAPTAALVGFALPTMTFDRAEIIDGVEIDYTSNELGAALRGVLAGNGNFLERVLGDSIIGASPPALVALRPLAKAAISRAYHAHYRGFATGQKKELAAKPTVKKLLYVLRTALTGTHLLTTGELETDLRKLAPIYGLADVSALIDAKRAGERVAPSAALLAEWEPRLPEIFSAIDRARDASPLPDEAPADAIAALEAWLVEARARAFLDRVTDEPETHRRRAEVAAVPRLMPRRLPPCGAACRRSNARTCGCTQR